MMRTAYIFLLGAFISLAAQAPADALTVTLGDQDYANGTVELSQPNFLSAAAGEPAPFNTFVGNDFATNFSGSWTFNYAPGVYTGATLTFGIWDHDSAASGDQVASFTGDGNNLTSALNTLFNGSGGAQLEVNVYTLDLSSILSSINDGSITFSLALQGPGLGEFLGNVIELDFNGAGLDFARLDLTTAAVPEPTTVALFGAGLAGLGFARRRKHKAA